MSGTGGSGGGRRKSKSVSTPGAGHKEKVTIPPVVDPDPQPQPQAIPGDSPDKSKKSDPIEKRLSAVSPPGVESEVCKTFIFKKEGHTLGNALRSIISNYRDVEFCGYSLPHPSEDVMHFRIQSTGTPVVQILERGFEDLDKVCEEIETRFENVMHDWEVEQGGKKKAGLLKTGGPPTATTATSTDDPVPMDLDLDQDSPS